MLCSVCGDLRISEIVDQPNWIVAFYFPRIVLTRRVDIRRWSCRAGPLPLAGRGSGWGCRL